jgi:hypothetical protein
MRIACLLVLLVGCHCELGRCPRTLGNRGELDSCENRVVYADGEGEDRDTITATFRYAAHGEIASYREVLDDGSARFAIAREYDARGRLVYQLEHVDGGEKVHEYATWAYDDHDRITAVVADFGDRRYESAYEYGRGHWIARRVDSGSLPGTVTYRYAADPLTVDELRDGDGDGEPEWGWRYTFNDALWQVRLDDLGPGGAIRADNRPTVYTYVDETSGRLARRDFSIGPDGPSEIDTYEWDGDRVVRAVYDDAADQYDQEIRYEYDGRGRLRHKRWTSEPQHAADTTSYRWNGDDIEHIERRVDGDGGVIESWTILRGCPGDRDMTVRIAPVNDWERALEPDGRGSHARAMWGSHDVL